MLELRQRSGKTLARGEEEEEGHVETLCGRNDGDAARGGGLPLSSPFRKNLLSNRAASSAVSLDKLSWGFDETVGAVVSKGEFPAVRRGVVRLFVAGLLLEIDTEGVGLDGSDFHTANYIFCRIFYVLWILGRPYGGRQRLQRLKMANVPVSDGFPVRPGLLSLLNGLKQTTV